MLVDLTSRGVCTTRCRGRGPWPVGEHVRRVAVRIERVRQRALAPRCQVCLCVLTVVASWSISTCTYCAGVVEMREGAGGRAPPPGSNTPGPAGAAPRPPPPRTWQRTWVLAPTTFEMGRAAVPRSGDVRSAQARWPAAGAWAKAEGDTTHCSSLLGPFEAAVVWCDRLMHDRCHRHRDLATAILSLRNRSHCPTPMTRWSGQGLARCYEKPRGHKGAGIHHYSQ